MNTFHASLLRIGALLLLLAPAAPARAAPDALVDEYMQKSGLATQIAAMEGGVLQGLEQAQAQGPRLNDDQMARLRAGVKAAFGADRLRRSVRTHLAASLSSEDIEQVAKWLDTPIGKRVTALEEASATPEAYGRTTEIGAKTLAAQSPERRAELERMLKAAGAVDLVASILVNQQTGVMRGVALSAGLPDSTATDEGKAKLDLYRSQVAGALAPTLLANASVVYESLSESALREYATMLELPSSRRVSGATAVALDKALATAAVEFGRRIGDAYKPAPTTT